MKQVPFAWKTPRGLQVTARNAQEEVIVHVSLSVSVKTFLSVTKVFEYLYKLS